MTRSRRNNGSLLGAAVSMLIVSLGCYTPTDLGDDPPEPTHTDVELARQVWLESRPSDYTFEIAFRTAMLPQLGYYRVQVANSVFVAADSAGRPVEWFSATIDTVWESLLAARARGELNSAHFNEQGVPVDVDLGRWEVDGGQRTLVRKFERLR